jgi:hypothetical protein
MDWALFPQLLFWCVLAILVFIGFIFAARLVAPEWHRQMFQIFQVWGVRWRAWRDPDAERRRQLWLKYVEVQQYVAGLRGVKEAIADPDGKLKPREKALVELFDMKAARLLVENEAAPFFESLQEADAPELALRLKLAPGFRKFHAPGAHIADFLIQERELIKANRHLVCEHLDRLEEFLQEEEAVFGRVQSGT